MASNRLILFSLIGFLLLVSSSIEASATITVDASPLSIPANGRSCSQVLITVLGENGLPVSDGTEVRLNTSAGDITQVVYTAGGRATALLTSSTCPMIATIDAMVNSDTGSVQVEFTATAESEEAVPTTSSIRLAGGSLAYSIDSDTIIGSNGVAVEYRGLKIQASDVQIRQRTGAFRAQGNVRVSKGDKVLAADEFTCSIREDRFTLRTKGEASGSRSYGIIKLNEVTAKSGNTPNFKPLLDTEGKSWISADRMVLIPSQKIMFFKASIYVGDSKVLSVPCYSYSYKERESIMQQVQYSSSDGMLVDMPFYYRLTADGSGALKLRYAATGNETGSYATPRKGTSLGLAQEYFLSDGNRGRFFIDSLASSSQAYEIAHHLEFGSLGTGPRADITARYQPESSYAKDLFRTTLNMTGNLQKYNYTVSGYWGGNTVERRIGSDPDDIDYVHYSSSSLRSVFRLRKPIISNLLGNVTPNLTLGYGVSNGSSSSTLYQSMGLNFNRNNKGSGKFTTGLNGSTSLTTNAKGGFGTQMQVRPTLRTRWLGGSASFNYTFNLQNGATSSISTLTKHSIGCSLAINSGSKWDSSISTDYGLDSGRLNLSSAFQYIIGRSWRMRSKYDLYRYAYRIDNMTYKYSTSYFKLGLYHPIGSYEIGVAWSPNGQDYGLNENKRIWLELGSSGL